MKAPLYGKFRGLVRNNDDPMRLCRIQVSVPSLNEGNVLDWAVPCVPLAAKNAGIFAIPAVDASVWIEFEQGDPGRPIWVGGCWNGVEVPPDIGRITPNGSSILLRTTDGTQIRIDDAAVDSGGITVRTFAGAEFVMDATGIRLSNGQGASIEMIGPTVTINGGALEVS